MKRLVLLLALVSFPVHARQGESKLYKAPETTLDFWNALNLERELGSPEQAAKLLGELVKKNPTDGQLLEIVNKQPEGLIALSRLVAARWTEDDKVHEQAHKDAKTLLLKAQEAVRKRATDEVYIKRLIGQLKGDREDRAYAIRELSRLREYTVPYLLDDLSRTTEAGERLALIGALERLGSEAAQPLVAALDGYPKNPELKKDVLDLLRKKHGVQGRRIAPFLVYPSANRAENSGVRTKARKLLADFLEIPEGRLPPPKVALVREAERYLNKEVRLREPVEVWHWNGKKVAKGLPDGALPTVAAAETYYGARFAQEALALDPDYRPAQSVLLSLLLDRAPKPLPAALVETVDKAELQLLLEVMDRALREERPNVLVPVIEAIGARAEVRAKRPIASGEPGLVRALEYKDRRVQLAAVKALLAIPGTPPPATAKRILEILKFALSPSAVYVPGNKVLVAVGDAAWRGRVMDALRGFDLVPVAASNGRDAMRKLKADAGIQLMVTESTLPLPGLAHFLAEVRADRGLKKLPVLLAAVPETRAAHEAGIRFAVLERQRKAMLDEAYPFLRETAQADYDHSENIRSIIKDVESLKLKAGSKSIPFLKKILGDYDRRLQDAADERLHIARLDAMERFNRDLKELTVTPTLHTDPVMRDVEAFVERHEKARARIGKDHPASPIVLKKLEKIQNELAIQADRYGIEATIREGSLGRFVARYPGVAIVQAKSLDDAAKMKDAVRTAFYAAPPARPAAVAKDAETAIEILASLAKGTPPGYDIAPVGEAVLDSLREGRLSEKGQIHAIEAASALAGARPQAEFATVILEEKRSPLIRTLAAAALIRHVQKSGNVLPRVLVRRLGELKAEGDLKKRLDSLTGILGDGGTGARLRDYKPKPIPVIPEPKEEPKDKPKEKEKEKPKEDE